MLVFCVWPGDEAGDKGAAGFVEVRQHRTIWQAALAREFLSSQDLNCAGILYVPASVRRLRRQRLRHISNFSNRRSGRKDPSKRVDTIVRCFLGCILPTGAANVL